jgi:prophage regulatory protein
MQKQLLRLPQVRQLVPYSRSEIYRLISIRQFPQSIKIGARSVAWDADQIQEWIASRIQAAGFAK